jgi:hypothetical protein
MKTVLYILDGGSVARAQIKKRGPLLQPGVEYAIATGDSGEFEEWQIAGLLEALQKNTQRKSVIPTTSQP